MPIYRGNIYCYKVQTVGLAGCFERSGTSNHGVQPDSYSCHLALVPQLTMLTK